MSAVITPLKRKVLAFVALVGRPFRVENGGVTVW